MKYKRSVINNSAPKCSLPFCNNKVSYHKKYEKSDGSLGARWKSMCEYHRKTGKAEADEFKKLRGCDNADGRLGWVCNDPSTPSLTIDHFDGNNYNRNPENIAVFCANCNNQKTHMNGDHLNRYSIINENFDNFFEPK
jgi:5-methylcytosine-specific restriction endonuclease McrA